MTSDPAQPSSPSELKRLLDVLHRAGGDGAHATELADLIWLASRSGTPEHAAQPGSGQPRSGEPVPEAPTAAASADTARPGMDPEPPPTPAGPGFQLSHPSDAEPSDEGPYTSLLAPLPPMLAHPLPLQRALRPLRRRVPSHQNMELDERSTAYRIARQGARPGMWLPVLRARPERWLTLYLVYDAGPTMPVWRPLWRELHRVIGQTGAFRGIRLLALTEDGRLRESPGGRPAALPPRDGRAAALILSDCSGPHWYAGNEATAHWYRVLGRWARTMPVAVVQPLPERLWRRTALPGAAGLLTARGPAAANSALRFTPYDPSGEEHAGLPLPLLEPSARWFTHWAELVAGRPGTQVPGVVATLPTDPSATPPEPAGSALQSFSPEELVLNFRAHASPQALRLAAHLAAGELSLPVMRLVQAATEAQPEPQHLAEVVLSGLLTTVPGRPATSGQYAFRPGVREVLSRALPRSTAARIGAVIQHHAGSRPGELPVVASTGGTEEAGSRPPGEPLAAVTEETVRRLGGGQAVRAGAGVGVGVGADAGAGEAHTVDGSPRPLVDGRYRVVELRHAGPTSDIWRATDEQRNREVTLKVFHASITDDAGRRIFLADANRLAGLDIQGLARVRDFGFQDDRPYVVTDPVDGESFVQLVGSATRTLSFDSVRAIGRQILETLRELHLNGLLHLDLNPSTLVMRHDGRVVVTDPGLGVHGAPVDGGEHRQMLSAPSGPMPPFRSPERFFGVTVDQRSDLYSLGCLFHAMAIGSAPTPDARALRNAWVHGFPERQPELRSGFPPEFDALVSDLLAVYPKDRPADAQEVLVRLMGVRSEDEELSAVYRALLDLDPDGTRMGRVLRDTIDAALDGPRTGRYDWATLFKTEKTHFGTQVEIALQHEFSFPDGIEMDYRIAGVDVDCTYSQRFGGWMIPPEAQDHLCLLVWADDYNSRWSAGLLRARREWLNTGSNRDLKLTVRAEHRDKIVWLWRDVDLLENTLLHMADDDREAVLAHRTGQRRLDELFRRVRNRRIGRNAVRTLAQQTDYMKRLRGPGGTRDTLRAEGIIILGDVPAHQDIARELWLPVPQDGEFVSVRVVPAVPGSGRPAVELDGAQWTVALPGDPEVTAPVLPYR
ncbi:NaeI family type II restriction endonuclease [Streptomyces sp. NPDC050848]|uniref:NaeI family type II restriction endonuclease n=1 Tax=Streptomyces sp. NPDC050848 TaxID=3155791 RepID=UPI00340BAB18